MAPAHTGAFPVKRKGQPEIQAAEVNAAAIIMLLFFVVCDPHQHDTCMSRTPAMYWRRRPNRTQAPADGAAAVRGLYKGHISPVAAVWYTKNMYNMDIIKS